MRMPSTTLQELDTFLRKKNQRFIDSLIWYLHTKNYLVAYTSLGKLDDIQNCMGGIDKYIKSEEVAGGTNETKINNILDEVERSLIPSEYLGWIDKKNERQCNFIWLFLKSKGHLKEVSLLNTKGNSDKYAISIKTIDRYHYKKNETKKLIDELTSHWNQTKNYTGHRYEWLDKKDSIQCEKAIEFLSTNYSPRLKRQPYPKPPLLDSDRELGDYDYFLASVDAWEIDDSAKEYFYKKITDAARKWKTPEEKAARKKRKAKAKAERGVVINDPKLLRELESIKKDLGVKNISETIKAILAEKIEVQAKYEKAIQTLNTLSSTQNKESPPVKVSRKRAWTKRTELEQSVSDGGK